MAIQYVITLQTKDNTEDLKPVDDHVSDSQQKHAISGDGVPVDRVVSL